MKNLKKISLVLLAFLCLLSACKGNTNQEAYSTETAVFTSDTELGQGSKTVIVKLIDNKNNTVTLTIHTEAKYLGSALKEHKIIAGEESSTGIYIKYVNGIRADYDIDKAYWSFSKNGEYMMNGVDQTEINDGENYELIYTKA